MSYTVKLEVFEGPFDLLFHLIEKAKVDIYNIPIAQITKQYLAYLDDLNTFDLEIASEFLLMAATLIEIKSKMLLPDKKEDQIAMDIEDDDPMQDLVLRLIEYKKFKNAAEEFKKREEVYKRVFYKPQEQLDQYIDHDTKELVDLDLNYLLEAFQKLFSKKQNLHEKESFVNRIQRDEISIEFKIGQIKDLFLIKQHLSFQQLILNSYSKTEAIVTFLALLELIKVKFLIVRQDKIFDDIIIYKNKESLGV